MDNEGFSRNDETTTESRLDQQNNRKLFFYLGFI